MAMHEKYELLKQILRSLGSVAVAFSGGADSTFLLRSAFDVLGDKAMAVTVRLRSFPEREWRGAADFCEAAGIRYMFADLDELGIEGFADNPANRCYLCKSAMMTKIRAIVNEIGIPHIAEGSHTDDDEDDRPGMAALREHGILSPLRRAGLSREDIRALSRERGLATWDKQPFACLATRFPYGERITAERLSLVGKAEQYLLDRGFGQVRVRVHGGIARIETDQEGFGILRDRTLREGIYTAFRQWGFAYVALDLMGYRTGNMSE
ncbi:MAG: ATP-dependent sacrificial sulfur transferase LarE [Oscillospiraceae bacterium]|nr:ATP-dependent sacrificial sulfur transferase LarE [Oscillospiraceae bacterium]